MDNNIVGSPHKKSAACRSVRGSKFQRASSCRNGHLIIRGNDFGVLKRPARILGNDFGMLKRGRNVFGHEFGVQRRAPNRH